jgi:hypothetical protein
MNIRFTSPTNVGPVISREELTQRVQTVAANLAHTPAPAEQPFGSKLKAAVKTRLATRAGRSRSHTQAGQEDFGKKLTAAIKTKLATR